MGRHKLEPTRFANVYRRVTDGRFHVRVTRMDPTGRPVERAKTLPVGATIAEARQLVATLTQEAANVAAAQVPTEPPLPSLADYCASWLKRQLKRGRWTTDGSNTPRIVASALDLHLIPQLGHRRIDRVTVGDLEAWMDDQVDKASPNSVRSRWQWVRAVMRSAAAEFGFLDPTAVVMPPRQERRTAPDMVLMPDEIRAFLEHIETHEPGWLALSILGFASGARPGELVTVKVNDLELGGEIGRWMIARHEGDQWTLVPGAKRRPEGRLIYLDPTSTTRLRDLTSRTFGEEWLTPAESVHNRRTKAPWPSSQVLCHALRRAGLATVDRHITGKVFRQTHNTLSQLAGIHGAVMREQVGHSSTAMTEVYTRVPQAAREAAARQLAALLHST